MLLAWTLLAAYRSLLVYHLLLTATTFCGFARRFCLNKLNFNICRTKQNILGLFILHIYNQKRIRRSEALCVKTFFKLLENRCVERVHIYIIRIIQ